MAEQSLGLQVDGYFILIINILRMQCVTYFTLSGGLNVSFHDVRNPLLSDAAECNALLPILEILILNASQLRSQNDSEPLGTHLHIASGSRRADGSMN
jgi:hypothetical protein